MHLSPFSKPKCILILRAVVPIYAEQEEFGWDKAGEEA